LNSETPTPEVQDVNNQVKDPAKQTQVAGDAEVSIQTQAVNNSEKLSVVFTPQLKPQLPTMSIDCYRWDAPTIKVLQNTCAELSERDLKPKRIVKYRGHEKYGRPEYYSQPNAKKEKKKVKQTQ